MRSREIFAFHCKIWYFEIQVSDFIRVIPWVLHCATFFAHNIATSKMAAVLHASVRKTNKGRFCRAKAFICNKNAANRLKASGNALVRQENEKNVRDPEVCNGFPLRGRRVVEFNVPL